MPSNDLLQQLKKKSRQFTATYVTGKSLRWVERFVFVWLAVFIIILVLLRGQFVALDKHYLAPQPSPGGKYVEGLVGEISGINPLFPDSRASRSAGAVIFSGLFKFGEDGQPVKELVADWDISDDETVYTVYLRDDAYWHDGEKVTADDVAFTIGSIQNPDVGSSLQPIWQGIEVETVGEHEIRFILPNPFAPFLGQLTVGILPEHLLGSVEPDRLRIAGFNTSPIGSGPFTFREVSLSNNEIRLERNDEYYGTNANLETLTLRLFETVESMVDAYNQNQLTAMMGGDDFDRNTLARPEESRVLRMGLSSQVLAFFNTERIDSRDLRQALVLGVDHSRLIGRLGSDYEPMDSPLLPEHVGYQTSQPAFDAKKAANKLKAAGWKLKNGKLIKGGKALELELITRNTPAYVAAADVLREQWGELGVGVRVTAVSGIELQQDFIRPRNYDILLFGIGLEGDPDVYAYWHSSQIKDPGLNLSVYESAVADNGLEAGRTRSGDKLRAAKYASFLDQWRKDAPAVALYRIHNYYVHHTGVGGIKVDQVPHSSARFHNVADWTVNTEPVLKINKTAN